MKERIPTPTGWRVLVMPWSGPEKTEGGIILTDFGKGNNSSNYGYCLCSKS
jgi:co-chaperonin GroES (HSP10)